MPTLSVDLGGQYLIESLSATEMVLLSAQEVNPGWHNVDLDGSGTTGYETPVSIVTVPVYTGIDLGGTYTIDALTSTTITLVDAEGVNVDWGWLANFPELQTRLTSAYVSKSGENWIGPFIVESTNTALLLANFVALQGLFKDNGKKQRAFPITIELEATPVDSSDTPIGAPQTFSTTIPGNSSGRDKRAATLVCELTVGGRQSVRARRTTNADYNYDGTVVDEVKWQDLYGVAPVEMDDFGNVTTVHCRTYATEGALNAKERKLNMLVTRKVPIRTTGTNFSAAAPTVDAANIFTAICLDPYIGNRTLSELDLDAIYGSVAEAITYFGSDKAGQFSATLDDDNLSFQETSAIVANAVFCTAFRQGSLIRLELERATEDSALLFNHRNKVPRSEGRSFRFGYLDDNDGVEVEYIDPADDAKATFYLPADRSATHPRQIKIDGIRTYEQAYWAAWRAWNKVRFQNVGVKFTGLQEAALVQRNTRVLIADNTRPDTQDGEILEVDALDLTLSQPVTFEPGAAYTMFIQLPDGTVDAIPVEPLPAPDPHHVLLGRAPHVALAVDHDQYALPGYQIVRNDSPRTDAFLITEREAEDNFRFDVQAVNYSFLYYASDQLSVWLEFRDGYIDESAWRRDGTPIGDSDLGIDSIRGTVHVGASAGDRVDLEAFNAPASYTKAFWVRRDSDTGAGSILSSTTTHERLAFGANIIQVSHAGSAVLTGDWPAGPGQWHYVAVTYDDDSGDVEIYVDGDSVASASGVASRTLGALHAVGYNGGDGFSGAIDDLRLFSRALVQAEVRALYRGSRVSGGARLTFAGEFLTIGGARFEVP